MSRGIRWLIGGVIAACTPVVAIIALVATAPAPPESYEQAVRIVLERRGLVPRELAMDVCPAGPTACYQRVYGTVYVTTDQPYTGFFACQRLNAECQLTIDHLDISGAQMPDIAAAGSLADRIRTVITYRLAQIRALAASRLKMLVNRD
jgi:hypothetical protein